MLGTLYPCTTTSLASNVFSYIPSLIFSSASSSRQLICKRFDLINMFYQVVALLYGVCEEFAANEKYVGPTNHLVNVAKGPPRLCGSFTTLDVRKLVVHQVQDDGGHGVLDVPLEFL